MLVLADLAGALLRKNGTCLQLVRGHASSFAKFTPPVVGLYEPLTTGGFFMNQEKLRALLLPGRCRGRHDGLKHSPGTLYTTIGGKKDGEV